MNKENILKKLKKLKEIKIYSAEAVEKFNKKTFEKNNIKLDNHVKIHVILLDLLISKIYSTNNISREYYFSLICQIKDELINKIDNYNTNNNINLFNSETIRNFELNKKFYQELAFIATIDRVIIDNFINDLKLCVVI